MIHPVIDRPLAELSDQEAAAQLALLRSAHASLTAQELHLDLTRGKPSPEQLDLANGLLNLPGQGDYRDGAGTDLRNYGNAQGVAELRAMFAELLRVPADCLIAEGNSSLNLMHNVLTFALLHGVCGGEPWRDQAVRAGAPVKFLCPVPGYDRHFGLAAHLGIELVAVDLEGDGPALEEVRRLAADPMVKGIWLVPMYSNPTGETIPEAHARALCELAAADDFLILWDNAYALHHLTDAEPAPLPILDIAREAGHPNRVAAFASTSKISFAGGGVAFLAANPELRAWYLAHEAAATIGPDKINQWRHVRLFGDAAGVRRHMARHRELLAPKFAAVDEVLTERLAAADVAAWSHPRGGYFVSLDVPDGTASRVIELARQAGVALTPAGSAFPYGRDPRDRHIRLAPSFPEVAEVREAMHVVATCVLLAALEQRAA